MTGTRTSLEMAQDAARDARTRLSDTFCEIKGRLQPSVLAAEAKQKVRDEAIEIGDKAVTFAHDRPTLVGMTAAATMLFLLRKPLTRLAGRISRRSKAPEKVLPGRGTGTI
jgi:hypothetical protein